MIEFRPLTLDDRGLIQRLVRADGRIDCEYSFGNMFCYTAVCDVQIAETNGCFTVKYFMPGFVCYTFPVGTGDRAAAVADVLTDADRAGCDAYFFGLTAEDKALLETAYPGRFEIRPSRDEADYVYRREDLAALHGKKYQSKRNHISFFMRNHIWSYEPITAENKAECLAMSRQWLEQNVNDDREGVETELKLITLAFEHYDALGFSGGLVRSEGGVVAYCMGEPLSDDVFCVHFEKAFADIRGAYAVINRQFAEHALQDYTYVNREDDAGQENLRISKQSYHPAFLVETYGVRLN
ncbi:MAG: DUF2156 domain-containing protein [Clostridia bacterium]|nr:DUF2156 domain-containing protein [Clostridia bacterium]MBR3553993.1 DUF2156 domain-containing protein [Clostridia bacterium]